LNPNHVTVEITPANPVRENIIISVENGVFVTAIEDVIPDFEWLVYPNPATNNLTIELSALGTNGAIVLRGMQGNSVRSTDVVPNQNEVKLDIADLASGMYMLELQAKGAVSYRKVMIVR
jgi:hypothetical protein